MTNSGCHTVWVLDRKSSDDACARAVKDMCIAYCNCSIVQLFSSDNIPDSPTFVRKGDFYSWECGQSWSRHWWPIRLFLKSPTRLFIAIARMIKEPWRMDLFRNYSIQVSLGVVVRWRKRPRSNNSPTNKEAKNAFLANNLGIEFWTILDLIWFYCRAGRSWRRDQKGWQRKWHNLRLRWYFHHQDQQVNR